MATSLERALGPVVLAAAAGLATAGSLLIVDAHRPTVALPALGAVMAGVCGLYRPMWMLHLAVLAIPLDGLGLPIGEGFAVPELLFILTGLAWVGRRLAAGRIPLAVTPLTMPLAAILFVTLAGVLVAVEPGLVVNRLLLWSCFFLTFCMVADEATTDDVRTLLLSVAVMGALEGMLAVVATPAGDRAIGTFEHPNTLGAFLAVALPAATVVALGGPRGQRLAAAVTVPPIVAGLLLAQSRGALVGAVGALVVFLAIPRIRRTTVAALLVALGLAFASSVELVPAIGTGPAVEAVETRFRELDDVGASDARLDIWPKAVEIASDHPVLGVGAVNFAEVSARYRIIDAGSGLPYAHAHNAGLNVLVELGALGFIGFCWLGIRLAGLLWCAAVRGTGDDRFLAVGVAGIFTAVVLHGMADDTLGINTMAALLFAFCGCTVVLARPSDQP